MKVDSCLLSAFILIISKLNQTNIEAKTLVYLIFKQNTHY